MSKFFVSEKFISFCLVIVLILNSIDISYGEFFEDERNELREVNQESTDVNNNAIESVRILKSMKCFGMIGGAGGMYHNGQTIKR